MIDKNLSLTYRSRPAQQAGPDAAAATTPLLLLLHGIGSNEDDLYGLAPYLDPRFQVASARAPYTLGPMAYGWFNIEYTAQGLVADLAQVAQSYQRLLTFIGELADKHGAAQSGVYLLGFSQGAMMSLYVALTRPELVAGVAALSGRLPAPALEHLAAHEALTGLPVLVTHGTQDPVIPVAHAREARAELERLPVDLTYREYPMGHEVSMESLADVRAWLSALLGS
ncbi:MAG: alpha/beta hydrolase [Pyrinomonadaceae bacterium]